MRLYKIFAIPLSVSLLVQVLTVSTLLTDDALPDRMEKVLNTSNCIDGCTCGTEHSVNINQDLITVNCSYSNVEILSYSIPEDVQVLNLKGSTMSNIPNDISNLKELLELNLSGNRLKSFGREGIFKSMSKLIYLNVGKNDISTIFRNSLANLDSLEYLVLSDNQINYIEDEALIELKNLKYLDLQHNLLGSLYGEWFHGVSNLITLNLSHNRIHSIPSSAFSSLVALEQLYLTGNRISLVDPRAFSGLLNLKVLDMKGNLISGSPTAALQSLPSLETLTLDQNPLTKVKPLDFSHLTVSKISLCQMPELCIIDAKGFYNLINASSIIINDNKKLSYIDPLAFMNVDALKELQLQNNNFEGLQKEMQKYLPSNIHLSIQKNPLRCDCNARWLKQSITQGATAAIVIIESENIKCHKPPTLFKKLLKDLDISKLSKTCPPVVLNLTQTNEITGKVGERQVIECRALGSPIPQLHWILPDGSLVNSTLNEVSRRFFPPGTLVYYHLEPMDGGEYTCLAQNIMGSNSNTIRLNVTGIDIRLFPSNVSPTFITLGWNGTERKAFPTYKIIYNALSENETEVPESKKFSTVSSPQTTSSISHLDPSTKYRFCIGYEDLTGYWLNISCCRVTTPTKDSLAKSLSNMSVMTATVYGFVIAAMTVLLAWLAYILIKTYKQRLYETPNKSERYSNIPLDNIYRPILTRS